MKRDEKLRDLSSVLFSAIKDSGLFEDDKKDEAVTRVS